MVKPTMVLLALSALQTVFASSGDRSPTFEKCVLICDTKHCGALTSAPLPLALRLTRWTCNDDCKYNCMHKITSDEIFKGSRVQQYHGKWPFWRFLGMQEPASVAFSLLNLWAHVKGAHAVKRIVPKTHPMRPYYLTWSVVSINAWLWSSVFHTRDMPITEKLDYFSAALAILFALYYTVLRMFHIYPRSTRVRLDVPSGNSCETTLVRQIWSSLCIIAYFTHVSYLSLLPRFDYTYNMAFNLTIGVAHNILWLIYSLPAPLLQRFPLRPKSYRPSYVGKAAVFVVLTTVATALELFDFPPWGRIIDAHALWHLSTAPIALFWYKFLIQDALDDAWRDQKM